MKFKKLLILAFIPLVISCFNDDDLGFDAPGMKEKDVTLLMYLVGQNDLSDELEDNIDAVIQGYKKTNIDANILIYADLSPKPELYLLQKDKASNVNKITVKTYPDHLSVDPDVMNNIVDYVFTHYPAKRKGMTLSSHANGSIYESSVSKRAFGYELKDRVAYSINITDLAAALKDQEKFDLLMFDACLMANVETIYELKDAAKYFLSAPNSVPGAGFPYASCMEDLLTMDSEHLTLVAEEYMNSYLRNNQSWDDFAAVTLVDVSKMCDLANSVDRFLQDTSVQQNVLNVRIDTLQMFEPGFELYDLKHWMSSIADTTYESQFLYKKVVAAIDQCIVKTLHSNYLSVNAEGTKFLCPVKEGKYCGLNTYITKRRAVDANRARYFTKMKWYQDAGHWRHTLYDVPN